MTQTTNTMNEDNDSIRELLMDIFIINDDKYLEYTDAGVWIKDKAIERVNKAISDAKKEAEKAYGGCHNCYGKGYATTIDYTSGSPDFIGDRGFKRQNDIMRFCDCERGKQLKTLVTTLKEQSTNNKEQGEE